jgi:DNA topoisomerase-1
MFDKSIKYTHVIEIPTFLGWKKVTDKMPDQSELTSRKMFVQGYHKKVVSYQYIESMVIIRNKVARYTESSLIQTMEKLGIGRPSTFASLVDTVQDRGYVKCTDIEGETSKCAEFTLRKGEILDKRIIEKTFGNEKSKLVIQPMGILCIEFLIKHFTELFSYDYTKNMECKLDDIATNPNTECEWYDICANCMQDIDRMSKPVSKLTKETYKIDDTHEVIFGQYGPTVKETTDDGKTCFHSVKSTKIDLERLRAGDYNLDDLLLVKDDVLGQYEGKELKIKKGKFGSYLEWGDNKVSLREWKQSLDELTISDAITIINSSQEKAKTTAILRLLGDTMSVRNGKFGPYVFYKTTKMKKPKFLPLKKCPHSYDDCEENVLVEWIKNTYEL